MTISPTTPANPADTSPEGQKLLDRVRDVIRLKHYSYRTEISYCDWINRGGRRVVSPLDR